MLCCELDFNNSLIIANLVLSRAYTVSYCDFVVFQYDFSLLLSYSNFLDQSMRLIFL